MRTLIIGLDGATWDVLMPLIKKKKLPTLEKLVKKGSYGGLESTIPPVTGGAWLAIATGKSPGKTGIIDFLNRRDKNYRLFSTNSSDFRGQSFWDYLGKANKKVGVFNYPLLFPPYKVHGFMISGIGSSPDNKISYPQSMKKELEKVARPYEISVDYHNKKYENLDLFIKDMNAFLDKFEKWIYYIIENKKWDALFVVFSATDWIQHIIWRHIDKNHPLYDCKTSPKYEKKFIEFWQRIDKILENISETIPEDTIVFLVSDHGFGPNDQTFNLAKWLVMKGYMKRKKDIKKFLKRYMYKTARFVAKTPIKRLFSTKTRKSVGNALRISVTDDIDFEKSRAYCLGHTIPFGAIYINTIYEKQKEEIKAKLIHDLENISEDIGKDIEVQIYEPKKLYSGKKVSLLPDIIFTINNWRCVIIEDSFDRRLFEEKPFSTRHTGSHRLNGIFLAYGPGIKEGYKIKDAKIYDIAPTILHLFELPIPHDIDGKVLMEIFEEDSEFARRKVIYQRIDDERERLSKKIKELKNLGKV